MLSLIILTIVHHTQAFAFLAAIPAIISAIEGISQLVSSSSRSKTQRPDMQIPKSVQDAANIYQGLDTLNEIPGFENILQMLGANNAAQFENIKKLSASPSAALGSLAQSQTGMDSTISNLGVKNAEYATQNKDKLAQFLSGVKGPYEQQQFMMNEYNPYMYNMQTAAGEQNAGMTNIANSATNLAGGISASNNWDKIIQMLNGGKTAQSANNGLKPFTTPDEGRTSPIDWGKILNNNNPNGNGAFSSIPLIAGVTNNMPANNGGSDFLSSLLSMFNNN
jgi:hypothetical protein